MILHLASESLHKQHDDQFFTNSTINLYLKEFKAFSTNVSKYNQQYITESILNDEDNINSESLVLSETNFVFDSFILFSIIDNISSKMFID